MEDLRTRQRKQGSFTWPSNVDTPLSNRSSAGLKELMAMRTLEFDVWQHTEDKLLVSEANAWVELSGAIAVFLTNQPLLSMAGMRAADHARYGLHPAGECAHVRVLCGESVQLP